MKKKLLAVGVAATLGALSGVSNAAMVVEPSGIGHVNVLPYYTVQNGNTTLISISNTDTVNGKAVKVRFRGAQFSDDVFDFQVFLSPADVWTAAVTLDGTVARLATSDKSCTLPKDINKQFVAARLLTANKAQGTREGYVEIINMGDIQPYSTAVPANYAKTLFGTIKHVDGVAPCADAVLIGSGLQPINHGAAAESASNPNLTTLSAPTGGLTSFATIINVASSKAFTIPATALRETTATKVNYWRQANLPLAFNPLLTEDRVFDTTQGDVTMYEFDLPDLSTPITATALVTALDQRNAVSAALAKPAVWTEYATDDSILASTDVVLSQPTRRYYYEWSDEPTVNDAQKTLATITGATDRYASLQEDNSVEVGAPAVFDREERTVLNQSSIVISPNPQGSAQWTLVGEVSVVSINNGSGPTGALGAVLTAQDYTFDYNDGLVRLSTTTTAGSQQLPVIGFTAVNVFNGSVGASGTNYGQVLPLKW